MEIRRKLEELPAEFKFKGYAKVSYAETSPLAVVNVEPIEGDILDELRKINAFVS